MILGLASVLALKDESEEAIELIEKGLALSTNEKQKATMRATLCFLYLKCGKTEKAKMLAATLPHMRECREIVAPIVEQNPSVDKIDANIRNILLG